MRDNRVNCLVENTHSHATTTSESPTGNVFCLGRVLSISTRMGVQPRMVPDASGRSPDNGRIWPSGLDDEPPTAASSQHIRYIDRAVLRRCSVDMGKQQSEAARPLGDTGAAFFLAHSTGSLDAGRTSLCDGL